MAKPPEKMVLGVLFSGVRSSPLLGWSIDAVGVIVTLAAVIAVMALGVVH